MIDKHDDKIIRCPRLGDEVSFKYCRIMNDRLPCRSIVGCWQVRMNIDKFLMENYSEEELNQILTPPKAKIQTLVEMVEKAKKLKQEND